MKNSAPLLVEETNLSRMWATVFLHIIDNSGKEISPLIVTLTGLTFGRMNCFVGVAKLDTITKSDDSLTTLKKVARNALPSTTNE
ncbi:MAG: hypothetical protein WA865_06985 [Spirulinaceae cyanobacterium]